MWGGVAYGYMDVLYEAKAENQLRKNEKLWQPFFYHMA
jgi:hypothetical protein